MPSLLLWQGETKPKKTLPKYKKEAVRFELTLVWGCPANANRLRSHSLLTSSLGPAKVFYIDDANYNSFEGRGMASGLIPPLYSSC